MKKLRKQIEDEIFNQTCDLIVKSDPGFIRPILNDWFWSKVDHLVKDQVLFLLCEKIENETTFRSNS